MKPTNGTVLVRALGLLTATLLVAGVMIGSGVFKKIVPLAQTGLNESWILVAWILAGVITMFGAFNLAGLTSLTDESGGVYEYLRLSFGNFFSFLYGWTDFTIIGAASIAALGFIFSQTINSLVPLPNPFAQWEHFSIGNFIYPFADGGIKLLAIVTIMVLSWVNYRGVKQSGYLNNIFATAKIVGILLVIILGLFFNHSADHSATIKTTAENDLHGSAFFSAFFVSMLNVLWAYDGWLDIAFITGEIKNPRKNLPLAIIIGVAICTSLYVLSNYAYMQVLPLNKLAAVSDNEIGASVVAKALLGNAGKTMISVLIMVSVFGALNAVILAHSRIYYRMAQENFFFQQVAKVHPQYRTPHISLLYTMIWSCILVMSGTFDILTDMIVFATFLFYGLLALALIKMKRAAMIHVKLTGYPFVQIVIILFSIALLINTVVSQPKQSLAGIFLVLTGLPFYFYFRKKQTQLK